MPNSSAEELSFLDAMSDVKPISHANKANLQTRVNETLAQKLKREALEREIEQDDNGLSVDAITPVDPYDFLEYKQDGVQEGVYKNLRMGKYQIDSTLNLSQAKFDEARYKIYQTIKDCHQRGIRTLLIQHGLGLKSKPFPGFMKSCVNQWLREIDLVIAFHTTTKQHGGLTAVYVLLKKHPNQKLINREKHRFG